MTDYIQVILNGLFTGIGVILAKEFWDKITEYRNKINKKINDLDTKLRNKK